MTAGIPNSPVTVKEWSGRVRDVSYFKESRGSNDHSLTNSERVYKSPTDSNTEYSIVLLEEQMNVDKG